MLQRGCIFGFLRIDVKFFSRRNHLLYSELRSHKIDRGVEISVGKR